MSDFQLTDLEKIIAERAAAKDGDSWTVRLLARGTKKVAEKFGEEAVETIVAAVAKDKSDLRDEAADTLYHLLVLLHSRGVKLDDVMEELSKRTAQSGVAEKEARAKSKKKAD
ncbi:phosphoribosyl-ATP diphosphatase [Ahrensia sp. R2A130]|uniref:phosphoribosyl-ATP diphosphatase n=1 Tax=Ahrensia sp. R2A130 TaxID=744979 RepID=UPI0001E0AC9E|nr:phosphoribosyl-ATP diphosphatase [Ahrensia sp. R2A130]EFL89711.1 phosphoribosyl-ATP diphosphatase [Ahrensia sp. R2A130]